MRRYASLTAAVKIPLPRQHFSSRILFHRKLSESYFFRLWIKQRVLNYGQFDVMSALVWIPKWQCTCATTSTTMMSLLQWSKLDTVFKKLMEATQQKPWSSVSWNNINTASAGKYSGHFVSSLCHTHTHQMYLKDNGNLHLLVGGETGCMYLKSPVMQFSSVRLSLLFLRAEYKICTYYIYIIYIYIRDSRLNRPGR